MPMPLERLDARTFPRLDAAKVAEVLGGMAAEGGTYPTNVGLTYVSGDYSVVDHAADTAAEAGVVPAAGPGSV